jgi:hypothetical protein
VSGFTFRIKRGDDLPTRGVGDLKCLVPNWCLTYWLMNSCSTERCARRSSFLPPCLHKGEQEQCLRTMFKSNFEEQCLSTLFKYNVYFSSFLRSETN